METFSNPEASSAVARKFQERVAQVHGINAERVEAERILEEIRHA